MTRAQNKAHGAKLGATKCRIRGRSNEKFRKVTAGFGKGDFAPNEHEALNNQMLTLIKEENQALELESIRQEEHEYPHCMTNSLSFFSAHHEITPTQRLKWQSLNFSSIFTSREITY